MTSGTQFSHERYFISAIALVNTSICDWIHVTRPSSGPCCSRDITWGSSSWRGPWALPSGPTCSCSWSTLCASAGGGARGSCWAFPEPLKLRPRRRLWPPSPRSWPKPRRTSSHRSFCSPTAPDKGKHTGIKSAQWGLQIHTGAQRTPKETKRVNLTWRRWRGLSWICGQWAIFNDLLLWIYRFIVSYLFRGDRDPPQLRQSGDYLDVVPQVCLATTQDHRGVVTMLPYFWVPLSTNNTVNHRFSTYSCGQSEERIITLISIGQDQTDVPWKRDMAI